MTIENRRTGSLWRFEGRILLADHIDRLNDTEKEPTRLLLIEEKDLLGELGDK